MQMCKKMCDKEKPGPIAESVDRSTDYDVVIIGGAFSGASSGILLKRRFPDLKILIVEKSKKFDRKVGESTSEVSACFLTRVLKISSHLANAQIHKHGLRLWFHQENDNAPGESSELGPAFQGRFPTFQLNRLTLDTYLLDEARMLGCEVARPANIKDFTLGGIGKNSLTYKTADSETRTISATWVIDASGKASLISRKSKTFKTHTDHDQHPVSSMWTRYKNVRLLDSPEGTDLMMGASHGVMSQRGSSTNHLMGFGWWCWIIPLDTGEFSAGITWDERLFTPPKDGNIAERLKTHLLKHPVGRVMFENAIAVENDNRYYKGLSYYSEQITGNGWSAVGDTCGFMDPLYSHGLDFCAHSIYSSYTLIRKHFSGECTQEAIAFRNSEWLRSYFFWFNALYRDKYWYLGDAELMHAAFLLDISTYFIGPVRSVYTNQDREFSNMPYNGRIGAVFAYFMRFYNRRLVTLAKKKIKAGKYGNHNLHRSYLVTGSFTLGTGSLKLMLKGLRIWLTAELKYLFVRPSKSPLMPSTMTPLPQSGDNQKTENHRDENPEAA